MFERSRVDNMGQGQQISVPAEVTLDDGAVHKGRFNLPANRPVYDVLNGSALFLEFQPYGGEPSLIAKTAIRAIKLVNVPATANLRQNQRAIEGFDPHTVLGVAANASAEDVRKAYHEQAKIYHPDRYATAELPGEVREYLAAMSRRINLAFQALEKSHQVVKVRADTRSAPVYNSGPRA